MDLVENGHPKGRRIEPFPKPDVATGNVQRSSGLSENQRFCTSVRCLLVTAFTLVGLLIVAVVVLAIEARNNDDSKDEDNYDEFFRTPKEQLAYERRVYELQLSPTGVRQSRDRCSFQCSRLDQPDENRESFQVEGSGLTPPFTSPPFTINPPTRPVFNVTRTVLDNGFQRAKRQAVLNFPPERHACCISELLFIQPTDVKSVNDVDLVVVQERNRGQYFQSFNCSHVEDCTGCGCCQSQDHRLAVVTRPRRSRRFLALIVLPGCCKCYNNLDPNEC